MGKSSRFRVSTGFFAFTHAFGVLDGEISIIQAFSMSQKGEMWCVS